MQECQDQQHEPVAVGVREAVSWVEGVAVPEAGNKCDGSSHSTLSSACLLSLCLQSLDNTSWTASCLYLFKSWKNPSMFSFKKKYNHIKRVWLQTRTESVQSKARSARHDRCRLACRSCAACSLAALQPCILAAYERLVWVRLLHRQTLQNLWNIYFLTFYNESLCERTTFA